MFGISRWKARRAEMQKPRVTIKKKIKNNFNMRQITKKNCVRNFSAELKVLIQ
jgi:hypothetical protein